MHRRYELAEEYADDDEDRGAIVKLRKRVLKRLRNQDALISVRLKTSTSILFNFQKFTGADV